MSLVFHVQAGAGTLSQHVKELTGKSVTDAALSQRRCHVPWQMIETLMEETLHPRAQLKSDPEAFYKGLLAWGLDGSLFSVANTPQIKASMFKPDSRRFQAAFAKVGVVVLVELGLHNPIAAAIGPSNGCEWTGFWVSMEMAIAVRMRRETTLSIKAIAARVHLGTSNTANARLHSAMKGLGVAGSSQRFVGV